MGYVLLVGAICCEVFATSMMKAVEGFTVLLLSVGCVVGYLLCFWLLGKALVTVNLSVGYAIWAALGIVLTSIIAVVMFGEQLNVPSISGYRAHCCRCGAGQHVRTGALAVVCR